MRVGCHPSGNGQGWKRASELMGSASTGWEVEWAWPGKGRDFQWAWLVVGGVEDGRGWR